VHVEWKMNEMMTGEQWVEEVYITFVNWRGEGRCSSEGMSSQLAHIEIGECN
jgi:hypothetical protein